VIVDEPVKTNELKSREGDIIEIRTQVIFLSKGRFKLKKKVIFLEQKILLRKGRMVQQNPNGETQFNL